MSDWTDENEKQVQYIGKCCQAFVWMYTKASQLLSTKQRRIDYVLISMNSISTIASILGVTESSVYSIAAGAISATVAGIQSYSRSLSYNDQIQAYKNSIAKYMELENNIKRQLSLPRHKREKAEAYGRWISQIYSTIRESAPAIDEYISEEYKKLCESRNLVYPDDINVHNTITIHTEQPSENIQRVHTVKCDDASMQYELNRLNNHDDMKDGHTLYSSTEQDSQTLEEQK